MASVEVREVRFKSSLVTTDGSKIVIALFDGVPPQCVGLLKCSKDAARALMLGLGSLVATGTLEW